MARATAQAAAATARAIRDAAADLFTSRDYAAVSIDDIARNAGVTRGAVYHHYRSKQGLFVAVAAHLQEQVAEAVVAAAQQRGESDALAELRAGSHAFLDAITASPTARVLLVDAPAVIGWAQWRDLDAKNSVVHLREALAHAGVATDLLDAMTAQLSGAMNEAALWLADRPDDADARRAAHATLDVLLDAVTQHASPKRGRGQSR